MDASRHPSISGDRLRLACQLGPKSSHYRSDEALHRKARRGALFTMVAVGYVRDGRDGIAMDPDRRVQEAISLVFRKFDELGSVRQVHRWLRHEAMELPAQVHKLSQRRIVWKLPVYNSVYHILTNPVYADAYVFGRSRSRTWLEDGRKRVARGIKREREDWEVLIRDHHQGYISWADHERNQQLIADNATRHGAAARGPVRKGEGLLAGLLHCGHCARRLHIAYSGEQGHTLRYHCRRAHLNHGTQRCISFGGYRVNEAVGREVLRALGPLAIEAAVCAIDERERRSIEVLHQAELALESARFEERRARRQYDAVDPDNRLVAGELERRWNYRLTVVRQREQTVSELRQRTEHDALFADEREQYLALGADLERAWTHERASPESRKRIVQAAPVEIVATVQGKPVRGRSIPQPHPPSFLTQT